MPKATPIPGRARAVVVAAGVSSAVGSFDLSGVNAVLPRLATEFSVSPAAIQWVVLIYLLPIAALALPAGRWLDGVGRRSSITLVSAGFMVASALVGFAPTLPWILAARVLQGCFGAGLFAVTTVMAYEAVPPEARARALALVSAIVPLGGIAGPSLGALIAGTIGWRWMFWVNLPITAAAIVVFLLCLPRGAPLRWPDVRFVTESLLLGGSAAAVLLALTWAPAQPAWMLLCLLAVPGVVLWRVTHPRSPVLILFRSAGFGWAVASIGLLAAAGMAAQYLVAFFAQREIGLGVTETGLILLFVSLATVPASMATGWLSARVGSTASIAVVGFAILAVAAASLSLLPPGWGPLALIVPVVGIGIGQGLAGPPTTGLSLSHAPPELSATAGSSLSFLRNIGFTVGPALMTGVWAFGGYTLASMHVAFAIAGVVALLGIIGVMRATGARGSR